MRFSVVVIISLVATMLVVVGTWTTVVVVVRKAGGEAVQHAAYGQPLRLETYERVLAVLEQSLAWQSRRDTASSIAALHFNQGQQQRDSEARDTFYALAREASRESLQLAPAQPTLWMFLAQMYLEQKLRTKAAEALEWSMTSGYYLERLREGRTTLGLALWDAVTGETRDRLMHSIVPTFRLAPEIVAEGAVRSGIVDDLTERFAAWPSEDQDEELEEGADEYGSVLAAEFAVAARSLEQAGLGAGGGETDDMRRLYAALAILTASNVPLLAEAMTIEQYLTITRGEDELRSPDSVNDYLTGVLDALLVLGDFNRRGGEPLFCMPRQDLLNYDVIYFRSTLDSMLEQMEQEMPQFDTLSRTRSVGLASLQLLNFLHPCETEPDAAEAPG